MDLVEHVAANLEIEESQAEKGIGALLMAVRVALDKDTFERVKQAVPNSERLMGRALMSGRTAEMTAMAGPAGLTAALAAAGFRKEDFPRLARAVLEYLRPAIGSANIQKFLADMPALQG